MLIQHYTYYLLKVAIAGLLSPFGFVTIVLLLAAIAVRMWPGLDNRLRIPGFWVMLVASVVCFVLAFRTGVYEFDERPESLVIESLPAGEPDCGTAWSGWIRSGYGMGNPCPKACYRGKVLNKKMRMRGLPPWPEYRREMQCWKR